ncbi:predicted protein [Uncinocarpus reesii 1704]|uniref:Uncharacterized protein n=1 Tax=Uncinocarpus reesii (strain UAMH 1704) TaxID=336963 RepID=C4JZ14_UNCRE|nr:uncharacterized protein UREG_07415 [Uncinocarpus reesii 1704]EEP82550.1 predicted protein [Uncinocarpus reesii 1704]
MILSGVEIVTRHLVRNLRHVAQQQQPCGVDLTLRQVSKWTSAATIDFDNTKRQAAKISNLPFDRASHTITLQPGAYLIDFNETVQVPRNCMASVFVRSSLWRSGVGMVTGVVDAGYEGAMGALLDVRNPNGVVFYRDAKLAQIVFQEMEGMVEGYSGIYQSSQSSVGCSGTEKVQCDTHPGADSSTTRPPSVPGLRGEQSLVSGLSLPARHPPSSKQHQLSRPRIQFLPSHQLFDPPCSHPIAIALTFSSLAHIPSRNCCPNCLDFEPHTACLPFSTNLFQLFWQKLQTFPALETEGKENASTAKAEDPTEVNGNAAQPAEEKDTPEADSEKAAGDKRDHDEAGPAAEAETSTGQQPPGKKQKTKTQKEPEAESETVANNAEAANGAKKRGPGRPKKGEAKKPQKTPTPRSADGIGSRTRSRTKA